MHSQKVLRAEIRTERAQQGARNLLKQVQLTLPFEKTEAVVDFLVDSLGVKNIVRLSADNAHVIQFRISDDYTLETIEKLKSRGIGVEYGFIDILDLKASLPREAEEESDTKIQREASLAIEEIYESVKKQASLSFDFIAFVVLAAFMAGFGLMQNNVTVIVASMLLSPLMGPMLGVALGYVVRDKALFIKGTKNELIALLLSFAVGVIMAISVPLIQPSLINQIQDSITNGILTEITRRGIVVWIDVGIAIFSGAAVAVSVTRGDMSSLVGVAISAALMPPAVNASLMIVLGAILASPAMISIGVWSAALLGMNIILIDISAIVMFRIKKLTAIADKSATWRAVAQLRVARSETLYHNTRPAPAKPEAATFTPAEEEIEASTAPEKKTQSKE
jgi:uncharacterized hydrophobic protein (TIGR00341 family)